MPQDHSHKSESRGDRSSARSSVRRARLEGLVAGVVTLGVMLIAVSGVYKMAGVAAKLHLRHTLESIAASAATTINADEHARLLDPSLQNGPEYNHAVAPLRKILNATPGLTYIYTAVLDDDTVRFVLDAAEPGDHDGDGREDQAQIWEEYVGAEPIIFDAFLANGGRGAPVSSGEPYHDEWGAFVTGYAPFHNADGSLAGIVGVDMGAERYFAEAAQRRRTAAIGLIPGALLSILVGFVVTSIRRNQLLAVRSLEIERRDARRLALIAERTEDAVVIANTRGEIEWTNAAFERMTGYTFDEVVGRRPGSLLRGPETSSSEGDRLSDAIRRREPAHAELVNYTKAGRKYWARVEVQPLFENGRHTGFMAIESDITERREAERQLRESEQRHALALEGAELGTWDWNIATGDVTFNERWASMLGYRLDEIRPHVDSWVGLVHHEDLPVVRQALQPHLDGKTDQYQCEHRVRHKDGRWIWILDKGRVIERDSSGKPLRACGTHLDITDRKQAERRLAHDAERFRLFVEQAPSAIAMFDRDMRYVAASRRWARDYGLDERRVIGRSHYDLFPEISDEWKEIHARCLRGAVERRDTDLFVRSDGSEQWLSWEIQPWRDASGDIGGIVMFTADITDRVRNEKILEQTSRIARVGGWELDLRTMTPSWSPVTRRIHGVDDDYTPDLTTAIEFYAPEYRDLVAKSVQRAIDTGEPFEYQAEIVSARGERIWVQSIGEATMRDGKAVRVAGVIRDITDLKRAEAHLRALSETDRLTSLTNRTRFTQVLREAVADARRTGERIAVLFFDFDRFKQVNDTLGHAAGDALLVSIANRFLESLMEGDEVARFGGDEFVVLLREQASVTAATSVAERLLNVFSSPHDIDGAPVVSTASIGLAMLEDDPSIDAEELLRRADAALFAAKDAGRNRCRVFDAELRDAVVHRHAIESSLREIELERDASILFEPVRSTESGAIAGYETTIAIDRPTTRALDSDALLAAIDDIGLGLRCFLHLLCRATESWRRIVDASDAPDVWISIPIARRTLGHPRLVQSVRNALQERAVRDARIRLRVSADVLSDARTNVGQVIADLRSLGMAIALDDFDGGVFSIDAIRDRKIDAINLAPALTGGLRADRPLAAVLSATINMSQNLGIAPIVVGVSDRDEISALQSMNGDLARGPAVGAPMTIDRVIESIRASSDQRRAA